MISLSFSSISWSKKSGKNSPFPIKYRGASLPVKYKKYGSFSGLGTAKYKYRIKNRKGLARVVGAGIYPNRSGILKDPAFIRWAKKNPNPKGLWDHVNTEDPKADFYVWTQAKDVAPGTKLFFTAEALFKAGHFTHALKAYYAILIHFPGHPVYSADHRFVWYIGPKALSRIETITKHHPEVGYWLTGAVCEVKNGDDTDLDNDVVTVNPGTWIKYTPSPLVDLSQLEIINRRGLGKVQLVQYENTHWQLLVNGNPLVVRGMTYNPTPVGSHVADGVMNLWMFEDENENGKPDAPYDTWVDKNRNGKLDGDEEIIGDFQLMKDLGVTAIRVYRNSASLEYNPGEFNKEVLRDLHSSYGIYVILGDLLGAYVVGSGALWDEGTDYTDPVQIENMKSLVRAYVKDHRNEPYVLMWLLGNENLMSSDYSGVNATRTKASLQVKEYLEFVNEVAEMIHQLDPDHPVAVGNLEDFNLEEHAKYALAVDVMGINSYLGPNGFDQIWKKVKKVYNRPVMITEYGCDAYNSRVDREDESLQAQYHAGVWRDIEIHMGGGAFEGNAIGGIVFEFVDEWWKSIKGAWDVHDTEKDQPMAFPDGWASEEWYGLMSQGNGLESPYLRQPREAYFLYRDKLWKDK